MFDFRKSVIEAIRLIIDISTAPIPLRFNHSVCTMSLRRNATVVNVFELWAFNGCELSELFTELVLMDSL